MSYFTDAYQQDGNHDKVEDFFFVYLYPYGYEAPEGDEYGDDYGDDGDEYGDDEVVHYENTYITTPEE